MAKISHFVVTFNHTTGEFSIDNGTTTHKFPDGVIFDADTMEWKNVNASSPEQIKDEFAMTSLQKLFDIYHRMSKGQNVQV